MLIENYDKLRRSSSAFLKAKMVSALLLCESAENAEKKAPIDTLRQTNGNQTQAARLLGINRVTVWNRMKKYGIDLRKVLTT
jgi:transcriptional regulator of acetoin/glycerol metabolism